MNIHPSIPQPLATVDRPAEVLPVFSGASLKGRDLLLFNPLTKGGGDHALANKIANIALEEGCRVTIVSLDLDPDSRRYGASTYRHLPMKGSEHDLGMFHNPVFIVAPVAICPVNTLELHIHALCEQYQFPKQAVVLIEEMDLLADDSQQLIDRQQMLARIGFEDVQAYPLGFGDGAIGYLPVEPARVQTIKARFEGELARLLDSYHLTLATDSHYHLAYISYDTWLTASQVFISNTLSETRQDGKDVNYILVVRELNQATDDKTMARFIKKACDGIAGHLYTQTQEFDYPALFATAQIYFSRPDSGEPLLMRSLQGEGTRKINIVFTPLLPANLFEDFICLSHSGMGSGDQSLGEFLSLTGKLPYYDLQPWKQPLVTAIKAIGERVGGADLVQEIDNRVAGRRPFGQGIAYRLAPNVDVPPRSAELIDAIATLDREICSRTADHAIRQWLAVQSGGERTAKP